MEKKKDYKIAAALFFILALLNTTIACIIFSDSQRSTGLIFTSLSVSFLWLGVSFLKKERREQQNVKDNRALNRGRYE